MTERSPANVLAAYEMLLEELEAEIEWVNQAGGRAFAAGQHDRAQELLERVQKLTTVHSNLVSLRRTLHPLVGESEPAGGGQHLPHGLKTPEDAYRVPILRTLVAMGGQGETSAVLDRVYELMKDQLNEYDLSPVPSTPNMPRWRSTAQWCRNTMREEGLIKADSRHGVWEISDAGRKWLAAQQ